MLNQPLARQLIEIVGAEHVVVEPQLAVVPGSAEELAAVMAACHAARMPVVPWGGGTRQSWGRPPAGPCVAVLTGRLNRVLIYEPDDLTISVEAGMTLAALNAILAANGQMLPLDGPLPARTTIGGTLATAMDGPRRLGYGTARDLLIGVRVVEASGRLSKAGGMVVKNVSGFDMMKLYLGSLGTLAIIISANFKLLPRPRAAASLLCSFACPDQALTLAAQIAASQLAPVAVEYLEGWGLPSALSPQPSAFLLALRSEGLPAAVERHLRDVAALAQQAGAAEARELRDAEHEALWAAINDLPQTAELADDELVLRLSCLPAELPAALADLRAAGQDLALASCARALSGVAYARLRGPATALAAAHAALLGRWPHIAVIGAPPALAAELPVWGRELPNLALMRRIKQEFDPAGLLNPGRYVDH